MPKHRAYTPVAKVPGQPGKYYNHEGYVLIWVKRGQFQLEHRFIAEQVLGRELKTHEVVHHIDGVRSNNAHNNLLICTEKYHAQLHRRCFARYGRWHLPFVREPYRESMRRLRAGTPLNSPNPVGRMKPPWEGSDTVTSKSTGSRNDAPLPDIASILRELRG